MRFSLIVASIDRTSEIEKLFKSFAQQTFTDFEVIIVDQNPDQRLNTIIEEFSSIFTIKHLRSKRGLSHARNIGVLAAKGSIVAFPDDDAYYPKNLLSLVDKTFAGKQAASGMTGRCLDVEGRIAAAACDKNAGTVNTLNVWKRGVATTLFLKRQILENIGGFDEALGLGAATSYRSGEETDLILRCVAEGYTIEYDPNIIVYHPAVLEKGAQAVFKAWSYGLGMGRVLKKHKTNLFLVIYHVIYPLFGSLTALMMGETNKAHLRVARCVGRFQGWKSAQDILIHDCPRWIKKSGITDKTVEIKPLGKAIQKGELA